MSWPTFWHKKTWQSWMLSPLSALVCSVARRRLNDFQKIPSSFPNNAKTRPIVIVVGNIVVGGSGKTPFIQWLGQELKSQGIDYGVVSRGYGGQSQQYPLKVTPSSDPKEVGDEPLLLAQSLGVEVMVSPKRREALEALMAQTACEVVISDDGLQHYALPRDIEIVMIDDQRGIGNGMCLPAGPLREPKSRLESVDFVVYNGGSEAQHQWNMTLAPVCFRQVKYPEVTCELSAFEQQSVYAMAGIGNPSRFYHQLEQLGIEVTSLHFKDHHAYEAKDFLNLKTEKPLLMTQKDAVKCISYAKDNWWALEIAPHCSPLLAQQILQRIEKLKNGS